jgi:hypothetical protein
LSNAAHSIEQRGAKWIIAAMDRTGAEQLASMLGVGRSHTSRIIQTFKSEGIRDAARLHCGA